MPCFAYGFETDLQAHLLGKKALVVVYPLLQSYGVLLEVRML